MDVETIVTTTIALMSPYLTKGGESVAKKVGEDLWTIIKKPFKKDEDKALLKKIKESPSEENIEDFKRELANRLIADNSFFNALSEKIQAIQQDKSINFRQINQYGDKSIYLENNDGIINIG